MMADDGYESAVMTGVASEDSVRELVRLFAKVISRGGFEGGVFDEIKAPLLELADRVGAELSTIERSRLGDSSQVHVVSPPSSPS
jgi:hypothetical protein